MKTVAFMGGSSTRDLLRYPTDLGRYPSCRDCKDISCNAISCIYNKDESCTVPSLAIIDKNGKCKGFKTKPKTK